MNKKKRQILDRQRELQNQGWEWDALIDQGVKPHSGHETTRHYHVKAEVCRIIANRGGRFISEATHPERGVADILDIRYDEPKAVIYEIETGCNDERRREKARQYVGPFVRETFVIDPLDAPDSLDELGEWVGTEME